MDWFFQPWVCEIVKALLYTCIGALLALLITRWKDAGAAEDMTKDQETTAEEALVTAQEALAEVRAIKNSMDQKA